MNKNRLESFSDGVFAFAGTLLIINVKIPDTKGLTNEGLNQLLFKAGPHVITFAFTFLVVGIFWVAHQRIFRFVKALDSPLIWLNIFYLLFIVTIPLPAAVLSANPFLPTAIIFYSASLFIVGGMHFLLLGYIYRRPHIKLESLTPEVYHLMRKIALVGPICYMLAAAVSFINVYISFFILIAVIVFYIFMIRKSKVEKLILGSE
jgi:uncharacterized membrane protein